MRITSLCLLALIMTVQAAHAGDTTHVKPSAIVPDKNNAGLKLPPGFAALAVTDSLGKAQTVIAAYSTAIDGYESAADVLSLRGENVSYLTRVAVLGQDRGRGPRMTFIGSTSFTRTTPRALPRAQRSRCKNCISD